MSYLLDTCVVSEFMRRQPEPRVIRWVDGIPEDKLFLSVITIGEIQRGIARLPESHRKTELQTWMADGLIERFGQRALELDTATMLLWGSITARLASAGQPMPAMDSLIAASALRHSLTLATRNVPDFLPCGVQTVNPWL